MNTKWWWLSFDLQDMEETFVISRNCSPSRSPIAMKIPFHLRKDLHRVSESILCAAASSSLWSLVMAQEDLGYCSLHDFTELQAYSPALTQFPTFGTTVLL